MGWDRRHSRDGALDLDQAEEGEDAREAWRPAPGKRSRTAGLARALAHEQAGFPHRDVIERAFGRAVPGQAHIGPDAAEASRAIEAEAFAVDGAVAFASRAPALHTAAHEAAHVLQERLGIASGPSDPEAHAEHAAGLVVRGESAAHLFGGVAAPAGVIRRRPGGSPAPPSPAEPPVAKYAIGKKELPGGISVGWYLAIGGGAGPAGFGFEGGGSGAEVEIERRRKTSGKQRGGDGVAARLANAINTKLEAPNFGRQFELEGLPDLKLEMTAKLEAEGTRPGGVVEAELSGDVTDFAVERGWQPAAPGLRMWLQVELSFRVEAEDAARLLLMKSARMRGASAGKTVKKIDEELVELEKRRASVARQRAGVSKKVDPALWEKLDDEHGLLKDEIRKKKGIRGAARKRVAETLKRVDELSRRMKGTLAKTFARVVGKQMARHALKLLPVVGWALWVIDAWEFSSALWKLLQGEHGVSDSTEGEKGAATGAVEGEKENEDEEDESGETGGGVEGDDGGGDAADAGLPAGIEEEEVADPGALHATARAVYDVVRVHDLDPGSIDAIWLGALDELIPRDLPPEKLDALCAALRAGSRGGAGDAEQVLAQIGLALEQVQRDDRPVRREPSASAARPRRGEPLPEIMTELPPSRLVEWKDGALRPTEIVRELRGLPFRMPDGTTAQIDNVAIVEEPRSTESEIIPFRIVIELRLPDGKTTVVVQQHALEKPRGPDASPTFFRKGKDEIRSQLVDLVDHASSGKVTLKPKGKGHVIEIAGASLRVEDVTPLPSTDGLSSIGLPGLSMSYVVVALEVMSVRGEPALIDDLGEVHELAKSRDVYFQMMLARAFME